MNFAYAQIVLNMHSALIVFRTTITAPEYFYLTNLSHENKSLNILSSHTENYAKEDIKFSFHLFHSHSYAWIT